MSPDLPAKHSSIAIISGEVSGDVVGAALARELLARKPDLHLWGIGSERMRQAVVELLHDSGQWSAIGVVEALKLYPGLRYRMYPQLLREIDRRRPSIVVLIDFGAFNMKVARWCRARGFRVFYYFPPGSWKRRGRTGEELARVTDCIATPFPWSEQRLRDSGANAHFVGHPLLEVVRPTYTRAQFFDRFGIDPDRPLIGLLPGSRPFEIDHNTRPMIVAASIIRREIPDAQFAFGAGSETARDRIDSVLKGMMHPRPGITEVSREIAETVGKIDTERRKRTAPRMVTTEGVLVSLGEVEDMKNRARRAQLSDSDALPPFVIVQGLSYDVMAHSDAIIVCSGTATLEAAILRAPMVIIYRGSRLMEVEYKVRRIKVDHIGLPNIIANERIVPEYIQNDATPEALAESTLRYLRDPEHRAQTRKRLESVKEALGSPGASARTAELVLETSGLS